MPPQRISDHTRRCRRDRAVCYLRWYRCSWTERASALVYAPVRQSIANFKYKIKKNMKKITKKKPMLDYISVLSWEKCCWMQCYWNESKITLLKSLRYHLSRMPSVGAVWFDLTKFQMPSKLLTSLVSDSRGYKRPSVRIFSVLNIIKPKTKLSTYRLRCMTLPRKSLSRTAGKVRNKKAGKKMLYCWVLFR